MLIAGAIIEEDTGDMKVKEDTTTVAAHFLLIDQFFGFSGSSGPDHVTYVVFQSVGVVYRTGSKE